MTFPLSLRISYLTTQPCMASRAVSRARSLLIVCADEDWSAIQVPMIIVVSIDKMSMATSNSTSVIPPCCLSLWGMGDCIMGT